MLRKVFDELGRELFRIVMVDVDTDVLDHVTKRHWAMSSDDPGIALGGDPPSIPCGRVHKYIV